MSDRVPDTEEIKTCYVNFREERSGEDFASLDAEFDQWLTVHDREVAAKTLRDAADRYDSGQLTFIGTATGYAIAWLQDRADRVEAGDE